MITLPLSTAIEITRVKHKNKLKRPSLFLGKAGIGKTASFENLAKQELNIGYKDIRLAQYSGVDAKGVPVPDLEKGLTRWLIDGALPREEYDGKEGILVLDEATSIEDPTVQTMLYQLTNERRLGSEYTVPEGWTIVLLGNREEDGGDYYGLLAPLRDRCDIYETSFDLDLWIDWASSNGVNPIMISFLKENPTAIHTYKPDLEDTPEGMIFATPRSWVGVSEVLNLGEEIPEELKRNMIAGMIPSKIAFDLYSYFKINQHLPPLKDVLTGKVKRKDLKPQVQNTCGFVMSIMIKNYLDQTYKDTKELHDATSSLNQGENNKTVDKFVKIMENAYNFISDFDKPLVESYSKRLLASSYSGLALEAVYDSEGMKKYSEEMQSMIDRFKSTGNLKDNNNSKELSWGK